jgi:three-Cys-motif partner protein
LAAWFPIIGSFAKRLIFIDGFAGPGEYAGGEPGSPVIALEAYRPYAADATGEARFLFIEEDKERFERLKEVLKKVPDLPGKTKVSVGQGAFEKAANWLLAGIASKSRIAPCFVMVDPFGIKGFPMTLIKRLVASGRVELYISFMYEFIDRFKGTPEFEPHLTALYGTDAWKKSLDLKGDEKRGFLLDLYRDQLKGAGAKHVLRFDLYRGSNHVYSLFFATQHSKGADVMKRAMWNVAPFGDLAFRGNQAFQLTLGITPVFDELRKALLSEFKGKGWLTIDEVEEFVRSDRTYFHSGQLKMPVLIPLERAGELEVDPKSRKRRFGFPAGARLRFR